MEGGSDGVKERSTSSVLLIHNGEWNVRYDMSRKAVVGPYRVACDGRFAGLILGLVNVNQSCSSWPHLSPFLDPHRQKFVN